MNKQKQLPIKPPRLYPGDIIGIAAPAGPFKKELFERGVAVIKDMGFEVIVPENLQQPDRYLAGSDAHRAKLLNELISTVDVKGIICARGGYGSLRILDLIDYTGGFILRGIYQEQLDFVTTGAVGTQHLLFACHIVGNHS